jgi:hypothetical protein
MQFKIIKLCHFYFAPNTINGTFMYFFEYDSTDSKLRSRTTDHTQEVFPTIQFTSFVFPSAGYKAEDHNKHKPSFYPLFCMVVKPDLSL